MIEQIREMIVPLGYSSIKMKIITHYIFSFPNSDERLKNLTVGHACGQEFRQMPSDSPFL
jgi:hypothetical protein